jgi:histidinol-phosphate aminotransferase
MLRIIEATRGIVVVDEAYQPFSAEQGFLPLMEDYGNLIIMRTLSKIGMAAFRVGYMVAGEEIIGEVNKVRLPFNVNTLSQVQAVESLRDRKGLNLYVRAIVSERKRMSGEMGRMKGITPFPSEANFILFKARDPARVHAGLLRKGVLIKNLDSVSKGCMRVTVGTKKENDAFLKALREALK